MMRWTVRLEVRTSAGEVKTTELVTLSRPAVVSTLAEVGLALAETKTLLAKLQASMLCGQVAEHAAQHRVCAACGILQPLKDRRTRRLQTLFGTVEVEAPRFKVCGCRRATPLAEVTVSPVGALLTARCTPELERVQAELGARTSFRDAAGILDTLLPASPANQESLRTRTHAVALRLEAADRQAAAEVMAVRDDTAKVTAADASRPVVMLDGAYIRAVPGHQVRNFEAICGKVERVGHPTRRFALVRSVAEQPHALLRAALHDQGWREGDAVTAISDGDPALPALVRSATACPVEPILDWFHLSMRVHHVEQVMRGLCALEPPPLAPLDRAQIDVERLRHLLWHGHHEKACEALGRIVSWAQDAIVLNTPVVDAKAKRLVARCAELRSYIESNEGALIDYGERYRAGKPISTSRAEGTVNQLVSARMNKRRQMRWSPRGAHRVLQVRAAVLDGRFPPSNPTRGVAPQVFDTPALLVTIPGVDALTAAAIVAEIGVEMAVFGTAQRLAAWAGLCPANHESAGKQKRRGTRKGNPYLKATLVTAAVCGARTKGTYLRDKFHRLRARMGTKKAAVAIAHKILVAAFHMLQRATTFADLGADYLDRVDKHRTAKRLVRRLDALGYAVMLRPKPAN